MAKRMKCPREGTKVVFQPNPASLMMYSGSYGLPPVGATGTVTTVPLPGGRKTCMPGPGGGLVYVRWDDGSTFGVAPRDIAKAGKGGLGAVKQLRCPRGCIPAAPSYEWSGSNYAGLGSVEDGLDDFEARDLLYQWHGGGGSGVYQVASMMDHGVPEGAYERARGELVQDRRHEQEREAMGRRRSGWLTGPTPVEELDALIAWLDGKIGGGLGHSDEPDEPDEPDEDDITTGDHHRWYQSGKLYFTGDEAGLRAKMEQDHFFPNAWFISDHGNAHLIEV